MPVITTFSTPLLVALVAPLGPQADQLTVEIDADSPAHADHHRLTVHHFLPALEVLHNIAGD